MLTVVLKMSHTTTHCPWTVTHALNFQWLLLTHACCTPCRMTSMSRLLPPTMLLALQVYVPPSLSSREPSMSSERNSVVVRRGSTEERGELLKSQVMSGGGTLSYSQRSVRVLPWGIRWGEGLVVTTGPSVCVCVCVYSNMVAVFNTITSHNQ